MFKIKTDQRATDWYPTRQNVVAECKKIDEESKWFKLLWSYENFPDELIDFINFSITIVKKCLARRFRV